MTAYRVADINQQTVLFKDGDPSFILLCPSLLEAAIEVENLSTDEQERSRFKIAGRPYQYAWFDLEPFAACY